MERSHRKRRLQRCWRPIRNPDIHDTDSIVFRYTSWLWVNLYCFRGTQGRVAITAATSLAHGNAITRSKFDTGLGVDDCTVDLIAAQASIAAARCSGRRQRSALRTRTRTMTNSGFLIVRQWLPSLSTPASSITRTSAHSATFPLPIWWMSFASRKRRSKMWFATTMQRIWQFDLALCVDT